MSGSAAQLRWDFVGISASVLCLLHCLLFPLAVSILPLLGNIFLSEEATHQVLAATLVLPAAFASFRAYRVHRRMVPAALIVLGMAEITLGAFYGHEHLGHQFELSITVIGSLSLILGHLLNHVFCRGVNRPSFHGDWLKLNGIYRDGELAREQRGLLN